jgi:RNA polymerase sigma-70 factor (ECF subfamily)
MESATDRASEHDAMETDLLVERAKRRDHVAFEALYRAHYRRVYALTLRMTCDVSRAEELTQEVFVRAWEALPGFRADSKLGTWLHTVAVRTCLNESRATRRRETRFRSSPDIDSYTVAAKRAMPDTNLDLERALAGLPPRAREVAVLFDIYGYRHEEIAGMLGIAEGTSKAQLHKARRLMREALDG